MALVVAVLCASLSGEPQCVTGFRNCLPVRSSTAFRFGYQEFVGWNAYLRPKPPASLPDKGRQAVCEKENWMRRDECFEECALKLVVTEPAAYRMSVCVADSFFKPEDPSQHIDAAHPLNGRELWLAAPAPSRRAACRCT